MQKGRAVKGLRGENIKTDKADVLVLRDGIRNNTLSYRNISKDFFRMLPYGPIQKLYDLYTTTNVQAKNITSAFAREYPKELTKDTTKEFKEQIKALEKIKEKINKQMVKDFKPAVKKLGIKGMGKHY